jgi:hypothetical protein
MEGGPKSARAAKDAVWLTEAVRQYGADVPNYRISGEQHYRIPYKDKASITFVEPHKEWTNVPAHRTLTELKAARRAERVPDRSYDIDGDGGIGPTDYFVAKQFSKEHDHRLNTGERQKVVEALESGMLDKYHFGYEQAGAMRKNVVKQMRGKIFTGDNAHELNEVYPPHWSSGKTPRFNTATELKNARKADAINTANELKHNFDVKNPSTIPEPIPAQQNMVDQPQFTRIAQRAESFRREARTHGSLDPGNSKLNPARETKDPGLGYVEKPAVPTHSQLKETRRIARVQELHETHREAEKYWLPTSARHTKTEMEHFEHRRPSDPPTARKLMDQRRRENIEYNMEHFPHRESQLARFSDQAKPWWTMREHHYNEQPATSLLRTKRDLPEEVTCKVQENPLIKTRAKEDPFFDGADLPAGLMPREAATSEYEKQLQARFGAKELGAKSIRKSMSSFVPPGVANRTPRYFDQIDNHVEGIKQAAAYSIDDAPLESFSSFSVIREAAHKEDMQKGSVMSASSFGGERSKLLHALKVDALAHGDDSRFESLRLKTHGKSGALTDRTHIAVSGSSPVKRRTSTAPKIILSQALLSKPPCGEDLSMTDRILASTRPAPSDWRTHGSSARLQSFPRSVSGDTTNQRSSSKHRSNSSSATPMASVAVRTGGFQGLAAHSALSPARSQTHARTSSDMETPRPGLSRNPSRTK